MNKYQRTLRKNIHKAIKPTLNCETKLNLLLQHNKLCFRLTMIMKSNRSLNYLV